MAQDGSMAQDKRGGRGEGFVRGLLRRLRGAPAPDPRASVDSLLSLFGAAPGPPAPPPLPDTYELGYTAALAGRPGNPDEFPADLALSYRLGWNAGTLMRAASKPPRVAPPASIWATDSTADGAVPDERRPHLVPPQRPARKSIPMQADATTNLLPAPDRLVGEGWHARDAGLAFDADIPELYPDAAVMGHRLAITNDPTNLIVYGLYLDRGVTAGQTYVLSAAVWIPAAFAGTDVLMMCPGYPALHVRRAALDVRDTWQRIWTSVRLSDSATGTFVALFVQGQAGDELYSTGWKLETGDRPSSYAPGDIE